MRAEFAALLVRVKSIRNLHFYDVVPVDDLLARLVLDSESPLVRKQLVALFLNSYFPQSVGGSSQVARCLALVKKHPEAALVFYGSVAEHASVGSVCKLAALLLRCSVNFVSRRLSEPATSRRKRTSSDDEDEEDDDDEEGFSVVGQIVVLEVISALLRSVHNRVMTDPRYGECKAFVAEQLPVESIEALLLAYSTGRPLDSEALSAVWKVVGYLGDASESALLEALVENLMAMDESSSKQLLESLVDCLAKWEQLPFLVSKIVRFLHQWQERAYSSSIKSSKTKSSSARLNPIVVLGATEYIAQAPSVRCPKELVDQLFLALQRCVAPILELDAAQFVELYRASSFRVMRLLEVFAKFTLLAASASVAHRASALLAKGAAKRLRDSRELETLQPSTLFEPPETLAALSQWVTRLLPALRARVHDENVANLTTKRRRTKKAATSGDSDADDDDRSAPQQLLTRWRNLFSLLALLNAESIAFAFEREDVAPRDDDPVREFVDGCVDDLVEALDDAPHFERVVFYQSCQLLFLLRSLAAAKQKAAKAKKANKSDSSSELLAALARWILKLQTALERTHAKYEDDADDLWTALAPSTASDEVE